MNHTLRLLFFCLGLLPLLGQAQWAWTDQSGRKVFSDRPPTPDVPDKNIFKRPSAPPALTSTAEKVSAAQTPANTSATAATPSAKAGVDPVLAERIKKEEMALAARRKAEEERIRMAKAENCKRIQLAQKNLASGQRIARTNAQGEREILDDAARAVEAKRLEGLAASECL
ncbi:DUF4124 domain-containing protein [Rhodoferax sp.]|uniref:DUF4124 domain-containing protein n=1 Tax=Rhodoferax sp. TaxID=50421 RepID=UPI002622A5EC|nr:DUF4124 domain-containing protein [Rhodoferax sp.]MDD4942282.1 DUF4124 domain-containing protein [Rhodoferax sp.]MDD5480548.1 DUF4124 domain-containing protein [Rhodoferax sp.]